MKLWVKYSPLFYTFNTRMWVWSISDIIYYLWTFILPPLTWILFLWLKFPEISPLRLSVYFLLFYVIFEIFYEIGYIFNDVYAIKKEKNKINKIDWDFSNLFWGSQIIFRVILWTILLLFTIKISKYCFTFLLFDLIFMWIIFTVHNYIRNYSINILTRILLRISKIILFVLVLNISWVSPNLYVDIEIAILLFYTLDFYWSWLYQYNYRFGWVNQFNFWYSYFFLLFIFIFFSIVLKKIDYVVPLIIIIPKIIFFLFTTPKAFSLKNNR